MVGGLYIFKGHPRLRCLIIVDSTIKRNIIGTSFNKLWKMSMMRAPTERSGARLVGFRQQPTASLSVWFASPRVIDTAVRNCH